MIVKGMTYTAQRTVTPEMTARAMGSGALEVLSTPCMLALMENAAMCCIQGALPQGKGSVGIAINASHVSPTPVGMVIQATAEVTDVSENGKIVTFRVSARDERELIGEGTHRRAVITDERFFQKCAAKLT